jgi:putative restriction endonuclease
MDPARKPRATYRDVIESPPHMVAEIIGGELRLSNRPATPATAAASALGEELGPPFKRGRGGPGGWLILWEPELHLGDEILVPDLAGWRRDRLPVLPDASFLTLPPDWVCEVLSKSTEKMDRTEKMPSYAASGVRHAWLVHPCRQTLETFQLREGAWAAMATYRGLDRTRIPPFDAIELDLAVLWADVALPTRAQEEPAPYAYDSP